MKVCFAGIGSIARRHIKNLTEICQEDKIPLQIDALRSVHSEKPDHVTDVYSDHSELPDDYDVLFLTNPTEYHAETLFRLHDRAAHFFIEKPVASLATMDKLDAFIPRRGSVYYVACPLRYTNVIEYLIKNLDTGTVRSVRSISSSYLPDWRPGTDYRQTYSAHKDMGGGVSIDLIHEWDYLTHLFGMPEEVKSFIGRVSPLEIDSEDYAIYIARYRSMIAELHLDYFGRKTIRLVDLFTDEDTIHGDIEAGTIDFLKSGRHIDLGQDRDEYQKKELRFFLSMIKGERSSTNDLETALKVLRLTQGIIQ